MKAVAKSSGLFLFWMFHAIALFLATTQGSKDARNGLGVAGGRNILSRRRHDATGVFSICSQRRRDAKGETDFRYNKEERLPAYIFFTNKITTGQIPRLRDTKQCEKYSTATSTSTAPCVLAPSRCAVRSTKQLREKNHANPTSQDTPPRA